MVGSDEQRTIHSATLAPLLWYFLPMSTVTVSRKGEARIVYGHPWIFRSDIARAETPERRGGEVVSPQGRPLGHAFHSSRSEIRLRMLTRSESLSPTFLAERLDAALAGGATIAAGAEAYRVVHGEGDGLPSLVVDRYGEYLVVQTLSQATDALKHPVVATRGAPQPKGSWSATTRGATLEGLEQRVGLLHGEVPDVVEIARTACVSRPTSARGRRPASSSISARTTPARGYARGRVLDAFSYNGGFGAAGRRAGGGGAGGRRLGGGPRARAANAERNGIGNVTSQRPTCSTCCTSSTPRASASTP